MTRKAKLLRRKSLETIRERKGEREEENEGGSKRGKVEGSDGLVGEDNEDTENEKVKLEVFETVALIVVQRIRVVMQWNKIVGI